MGGVIFCFAFTLWLGISSLIYGKSKGRDLPTTVATCAFNKTNADESMPQILPQDQTNKTCTAPASILDDFYSISYLWFSPICIISFLLLSLLVTACTKSKHKVDPALIWTPHCFKKHTEENGSDEKEEDEEEEDVEEKIRLHHSTNTSAQLN